MYSFVWLLFFLLGAGGMLKNLVMSFFGIGNRNNTRVVSKTTKTTRVDCVMSTKQ